MLLSVTYHDVCHTAASLFPACQVLDAGTDSIQNCFFPPRGFQFSASHSDSPIVGASDIGQISAYTCKAPELPLGTSKGPLHFVQYKGSTKVIRY